MLGRDVLMQTLLAHGVEQIFGNPGTTESPVLDALQQVPQIHYRVHLHEGVALGAANFYAQASGKVGVVNLHVAPGLGNAIGMMYNALKARSPLVVTAGQQDTRMRLRNPVLGHDLVAMAAPVTKWSVQVERADEIGPIFERAFKIATEAPAGPVFVALPIDVMEQQTQGPIGRPATRFLQALPDPSGVERMANLLAASRAPAIVVGDDVARGGATQALLSVVETLAADVWFEGIRARSSFPGDHAAVRGLLAFDAAGLARQLQSYDTVLLLGGPFFEEVWYAPGSPFPGGAKVLQIEESASALAFNFSVDAGLQAPMKPALEAIEQGLRQRGLAASGEARARAEAQVRRREEDNAGHAARAQKAAARVPASMSRALAEVRAGAPDNVVVVDETITAGPDLFRTFPFRAPDDYFSGRGGGIGQGLAGAIGVSIGLPDRPTLCISGDGSAMYSIQALWTAAHHQLPIVFVILANREYRVLKHNLDAYRQRFATGINQGYPHMDLNGPALQFAQLARSMGIEGVVVSQPDGIAAAVRAAFASKRPTLVEIEIEGKRA